MDLNRMRKLAGIPLVEGWKMPTRPFPYKKLDLSEAEIHELLDNEDLVTAAGSEESFAASCPDAIEKILGAPHATTDTFEWDSWFLSVDGAIVWVGYTENGWGSVNSENANAAQKVAQLLDSYNLENYPVNY